MFNKEKSQKNKWSNILKNILILI